MGVHLSGKHASELKLLDLPLGGRQFVGDVAKGIFVVFGFCKDLQFRRLFQRPADPVECVQCGLQASLFLAQRLSPLRVGPDIGIFQCTLDIREALPLDVVVKDNPLREPQRPFRSAILKPIWPSSMR